MSGNDKVTEGELIAKAEVTGGKRVTLQALEGNILSEHTFQALDGVLHVGDMPNEGASEALGLLTICVMVLRNGFTVHGVSACADPKNFDMGIGKRLARADAIGKIWPLMGYHLKEEIHEEKVFLSQRAFETSGDMGCFIGTKAVNAKPMTRQDYNDLRGWQLPADENGADEGYLVEYTDRIENHVDGFRGYVSWSPKEVFERAYNPTAIGAMDLAQIKTEGDFKGRVRSEALGLEQNINRLDVFINGNSQFTHLKAGEQADLVEQLAAMKTYKGVLDRRIAGF